MTRHPLYPSQEEGAHNATEPSPLLLSATCALPKIIINVPAKGGARSVAPYFGHLRQEGTPTNIAIPTLGGRA